MNDRKKLMIIRNSISLKGNRVIFDQEYAEKKQLSPEVIELIRSKVKHNEDIEVEQFSIDDFLFPIVIWAIDSLKSYLLKELFTLGIVSFCKTYSEHNEVTSLLCKEIKK